MENVDNFGIVGKAGKVSKVDALGQLWPKLVQLVGFDQLCSKNCLLFYSFMLRVLPIIPPCL